MNDAKRKAKQVVFASIVFFIIGGAGLWLYFNTLRSPECFNGIQDIDEDGIDCGGSCPPCAVNPPPPGAENFKVGQVAIIPLSNNSYDLLAEIRNSNNSWGARSLNYKFNLYDENKQFISAIDGQDYVMPGNGSKYVIKHVSELDKRPATVKFEMSSVEWEDLPDYINRPKFSIWQKTLNEGSNNSSSYAEGVLENANIYGLNVVSVKVVVTGESGNFIGVGSTDLGTMNIGERRYFKINWPDPFREKVKNVDWYVETNILNPDNFIRKTYQTITSTPTP